MPRLSRVARPAARAAIALVALAAAAAVAFAVLWLALPSAAPLARENPRTTAVIDQRRAEARARGRVLRVRQSWVPLSRVSPRFLDAVLLSEDTRFFGHEGIDWEAVRDAAEHDLQVGRFARGASTITQQLAKNLWLGTEKSLWRKAKEALLATKLERQLPKRRILALYVNVVELGDGVFGVEAGARRWFGVPAASLSAAQAVVLASMLPAPRRVDVSNPSTWLKRRSRRLLDRMAAAHRIGSVEHLFASAELDRLLAGPAPSDDLEEPPPDDDAALPRAVTAPAPRRIAPVPAREPPDASYGATAAAPAEGE